MTYCISWDEESFHGSFDSIEEALAEASEERGGPEYFNDAHIVWIGEQREPRSFFNERWVGEHIAEHVSEQLFEEVGEAADNFKLTPEQAAELGKLVLDWIETGPKFNCYGVTNITKHELPARAPEGGAA
jgi:hypothetical protein